MNINDLILSIEVERDETIRHRDRALAEARHILEMAKQDGRAALTDEENQDMQAALNRRERAEKDLVGIQAKLDSAAQIRDAERAVDQQLAETQQSAAPGGQTTVNVAPRKSYDQVVRVGREERTYHRGNAGKGGAFVRDVLRQFLYRDVEAEARLTQHMREERVERGVYLERAVGTGAFAGLTVPQYLTEMYAPATAALRPFADACNKHDLPGDGMTVNISRITTATGVALQSSENSAVQETNADDTLLTETVQTAAGQQTISRQAIDRGTGIEEVVMDDLFRRYATALDSTLLNQATTGMTNVATATAYTDASPTGPELYPKILGAGSGVDAALLGFGTPDIAVMHSRRWAWLQSQLTTSWPMISQPSLDPQTMGKNLATRYGSGARGVLPNGLTVIVDNNVATNLGAGTNEDEIYVVPSSECHLWEDPAAPVFIRAEQAAAASLGVLLVVYGYFAYSFRRFSNGMAKVNGTGLITPSF
jgi:hypothetical protein